MKQLVVSSGDLETRVAVLEDGRAAELYVERLGQGSLVGNVYKGRVENVLAGMDAAFVDIGTERNGFLYVDEVVRPEVHPGRTPRITELLQGGKEVVVQVVRDAMGSKGPRLTTQVGIAGRYVVYMPYSESSGVSRRLESAERERLRSAVKALDTGPGGVIVRTAARGAAVEAIDRDMRFLRSVWDGAEGRAAASPAPVLVYEEADLALRAVRDILGPEFGAVLVDDPRVYGRVSEYVRAVAPELEGILQLREGRGSLFSSLGLDRELRKALLRRVDLPSGGYLIIDHTEAMTVIDVNTGRYVGRRYLEETTLRTNVEACREVVRQLRLRDIGGIIVIDFIDMAVRTNREAVLVALETELAQDRTKTYVVEISPLGLVEMTRQNVAKGLREVVTVQCPYCKGEGRVVSEDTALIDVERRLRDIARESSLPVVRVELHPRTAARLQAGRNALLRCIEADMECAFVLEKAADCVPLDHVRVVPD